ncbi:MAG: ABC transporter ATP-binding protein [Xanthobacteraceae bacterium]
MSAACLAVDDLHSYYGESHILRGLSFTVPERGVVALLGRNGAGKTTALRSLMNLVTPRAGTVRLRGDDITGRPTYAIVRLGMTLVPEHRGMFASLTVLETLRIAERRQEREWTIERVLAIFPRLAERLRNRAMQLSGGEQQMLAIARALLLHPRLLLLDEPTEGLAPIIVDDLLGNLQTLKQAGMAMLLVEQNVGFAARLADQAILLGKGAIQWNGPMAELQMDSPIVVTWLGV